MTDKQIIIDETKCPWFNDGSCDLFYSDKEECWYRKCKDTPNCYYRETQTQLKAKEQECEELKENLPNAITRLMGELDQLKAENDELKEELNKKYSVSGFNVIFMKEHIHELQDQVLELTEIIKKQNGEYDKLRQSYEHTSNSLHCFIKKGSELRYANIAMKNKYRKEVNKQRESIERFKTFLNELKELLNHCSKQDICTTCDYSEECNLGDEEIPTYDICKFLLNKINQHQ